MPTRRSNRVLRTALPHFGSFLVTLAAVGAVQAQPSQRVPIMESYPDKIQQLLEAKERALRQAIVTAAHADEAITVQYVLDMERRWDQGSVLSVAFSGGTPELRAKIEAAASEWSRYCNIKFDFRVGGKFREWSTSDQDYKAKIRIAFNGGDYGGYWSALGNESAKADGYKANEASMNFEKFPDDLPSDYAATVKHEFGHALGFWHEHQHPKERCDDQLRWNDEPGYIPTRDEYGGFISDPQGRKPGVYTVFGGPPNNWKKDKVDFAMRRINDADTHAYKVGPFDQKSIMKYYYPDWLFIDGARSRCYHEDNLKISAGDRAGVAAVYPKTAKAIKRVLDEKKRVLDMLLQMKGLSPELEQEYRSQRDSLPK
jgi:hypothetical protein